MEIITLKINKNTFSKFKWLIGHFSADEVNIVNEIDILKLPNSDFDYISTKKMNKLKQLSINYKNGDKDNFKEYTP